MKKRLLSLGSLRKEIDRIDDSILNLLAKRMRISLKVAKFKKKHNARISQPKREKEVLKRLKKQAKDSKIDVGLVEIIYKSIMKQSKDIQKMCTGKRKR